MNKKNSLLFFCLLIFSSTSSAAPGKSDEGTVPLLNKLFNKLTGIRSRIDQLEGEVGRLNNAVQGKEPGPPIAQPLGKPTAQQPAAVKTFGPPSGVTSAPVPTAQPQPLAHPQRVQQAQQPRVPAQPAKQQVAAAQQSAPAVQAPVIPIDHYDCILRINNMMDLYDPKKGWHLETNERFNPTEELEAVRVVPIGQFNAGKTFTINKLLGKEVLPTGKNVHTEGFSFVRGELPDPRTTCFFMDTEGLETPVSIEEIEAKKEELRNKNKPSTHDDALEACFNDVDLKEGFRKKFSYQFGQVFLFVTGQLSRKSQYDLLVLEDKVAKEAADSGKRKTVIVIHNLKEWSYEKVFDKDYVEPGMTYANFIKQLFSLGENFVGELDENNKIYHVFMVQNEGDKQTEHNKATISFIRKKIAEQTAERFVPSTYITKLAENLQSAFVYGKGEKLSYKGWRILGAEFKGHRERQTFSTESQHKFNVVEDKDHYIIQIEAPGCNRPAEVTWGTQLHWSPDDFDRVFLAVDIDLEEELLSEEICQELGLKFEGKSKKTESRAAFITKLTKDLISEAYTQEQPKQPTYDIQDGILTITLDKKGK